MRGKTKTRISRGVRINPTHHVIEVATELITKAKGYTAVTKVVPGRIAQVRSGERRLAVRIVQAGLKIIVRGSTSLQEFYIYTADQAEVEALLKADWKSS